MLIFYIDAARKAVIPARSRISLPAVNLRDSRSATHIAYGVTSNTNTG
jgi:hypothetical protein